MRRRRGPIEALSSSSSTGSRARRRASACRASTSSARLGTPHAYRCGFWAWVRPRPHAATLRALRAPPTATDPRAAVRDIAGAARDAAGRAGRAGDDADDGRDRDGDLRPARRSCCGAQLDSIRAQTLRDWVCVISDDCSDPERFAALEDMVAGDERFVVSRSERRPRASTRTSSGRSGWCRPGARVRRARRPGRRLAPGQAGHAGRRARRRPAGLQRRAAGRPGRRRCVGETYWADARQQPHRPAVAAGRQRRDRRGVAVPARPARPRAAVPARRSSRTSTTTGSALCALRPRARSPTSTGRCTTTSSTARAALGHAAANQVAGCASGSARCAPTRATASACTAASTSSTSRGSRRSRRSCCRAGAGMAPAQAPDAGALPRRRPLAARARARLWLRGRAGVRRAAGDAGRRARPRLRVRVAAGAGRVRARRARSARPRSTPSRPPDLAPRPGRGPPGRARRATWPRRSRR